MKRCVFVVIAVAAAMVYAEGVFVGPGESVIKNVVSQEIQTDGVYIAPGGSVLKTGEGVWKLPYARVKDLPQATINVQQGSLQFTDDAAAPLDTSSAENILREKAALWMDMTSVVTEADNETLVVWRDVRDTDANVTNYPYAVPPGVAPLVTTYKEKPALHFGGYGNGRTVRFTTAEGVATHFPAVKHLFCVMSVRSGGTSMNDTGYWLGSDTDTLPFERNGLYYTANNGNSTFKSGQCYLNGIFIDPTLERIKYGRQLLDYRTDAENLRIAYLFSKKGGHAGGGYFHEAIFFTNQLTQAEHAQVRSYLMNKWELSSRSGLPSWFGDNNDLIDDPLCDTPATLYAVDGASVLSPENSVFSNLLFGGTGRFHMLGVQQLFPKTAHAFNGELRVDNQIKVRAPVILAVEPKDRFVFTVENTGDFDTILTRTGDAADGTVEQTGGEISLRTIPESVKSFEVSSGTLRLTVPRTEAERLDSGDFLDAGGKAIEAAIPDPSFEAAAFGSGGQAPYNTNFAVGETKNGWTAESATVRYYRHAKDTDNAFGSMDSPDGDVSLGIVNAGKVWTTVTVSEPGYYRLSFKASARYARVVNVNAVSFAIGDADGANFRTFGTLWLPKPAEYRLFHMDAGFLEAKTYRLKIGSEYAEESTTYLDDLHLVKVADASTDWPIPNGGFEAFSAGPVHAYPYAKNVLENWDVQTTSFATAEYSYVGAIQKDNLVFMDSSSRYLPSLHSSQDSLAGQWALMMYRAKGNASTTFTPPAGYYLLAADAKSYRLSIINNLGGVNPAVLKATLTIGETVVDLGTVSVLNNTMEKIHWPVPIVVDGSQTVTLTLSQTDDNATAVVDNLRLTRDLSKLNLVQNGGFEAATLRDRAVTVVETPWVELETATDADASQTMIHQYDKNTENFRGIFASERGEGYAMAKVRGAGGYSQPITLPFAGTYELSFMASSRHLNPSSSGRNPIRAWLAKGGVTNDIATVEVHNTKFVTHRVLFDVAEAGEYTFGICGTSAGKDRSSNVDAIRISPVSYGCSAPALHKDLKLVLEDGSRLHLDYPGTQEVYSVRINGTGLSGEINRKNYPLFIKGIGTLIVKPKGTMIIIR